MPAPNGRPINCPGIQHVIPGQLDFLALSAEPTWSRCTPMRLIPLAMPRVT